MLLAEGARHLEGWRNKSHFLGPISTTAAQLHTLQLARSCWVMRQAVGEELCLRCRSQCLCSPPAWLLLLSSGAAVALASTLMALATSSSSTADTPLLPMLCACAAHLLFRRWVVQHGGNSHHWSCSGTAATTTLQHILRNPLQCAFPSTLLPASGVWSAQRMLHCLLFGADDYSVCRVG
jgi:hypothetical protein